MPRRKKYIPGIFNYCDRWCERCPFTSRCRTFAVEKSMNRLIAKKERENAEFWAAMEKTLGEAIDPAIKESLRLFEDPKTDGKKYEIEPVDEFEQAQMERRDRFVEKEHPLGKRSMEYAMLIDPFFKRIAPGEPPQDVQWRDAWEVIHWYKYFIHVKFCRALHGMMDEREEEDFYDEEIGEKKIEIPCDVDGSAKVAIIGIERSISAWSMLREHFPKEDGEIVKAMALLMHVRALADKTFPKARAFHRPGFDDLES
jgi:hypothetical protein